MRFFCSGFLHWSNIHRPNKKAFDCFSMLYSNSPTYSNFLTFRGDSVDAESHSPSTESTPSETPCRLSQRRVRLHVNWVNAEWWMLVPSALTQLTWSLIPRWLSWRGVSLRVNSVDGESHSAWTQCAEEKLYQNRHTYPAPRWLSQRRVTNNLNISANSILYSKRI